MMTDAVRASDTSNTSQLRQALDQAGWRPRHLARAVNAWLEAHGRSTDRIDESTAYPWVRLGYCPHNDVPEIVARVLTQRLGRYVSASELWPGHARAVRINGLIDPADGGGIDDVLRMLDHLANGGRPPALSGDDLGLAMISALRDPILKHQPAANGRERVHSSQATVIADHVAALRTLDDSQGGGVLSLRYVVRELSSVLDLARCGAYEPGVGDILLTCVADLAQIAGWMWFDAGAEDIGVHLLRLGSIIARAAHDDDRAANSAAMVSYIAATAGAGTSAMVIATAACQMPSTSQRLAARLQGRLATAAAAAGDITTFRTATDRAQDLLASAPSDHTQPYLYYLSPDQLAAEAGYSLVSIAARTTISQASLLKEARKLLEPRAQLDGDPGYQRSAVLHGCQLARVHLMLRDLDGAVETARTAVARLPNVQSGRCVKMLRSLYSDLAKRQGAQVVAQFLPDFDMALQLCG